MAEEAYFPGDTELRRQIRKYLQADPGNKSRLAREFKITEGEVERWEWGQDAPGWRVVGKVFAFIEKELARAA